MIKRFIHYLEVQTKITSLFTFVYTLVVLFYWNAEFKWLPLLVFFISMFLFDLTTTVINNYIDAKGNGLPTGFSQRNSLLILILLLVLSIMSGLYLVFLTDYLILFVGMFCFAVGILYTFGPIPISRQPYGEIISGLMYGYFIPFIMIHINYPEFLVSFVYQDAYLMGALNLVQFIQFVLVFLTPTLLTASIMLANNTCDIDKDILVKRFTLPYYIGKKWAVRLMIGLYLVIYLDITIASVMGFLPLSSLLTLVSAPLVYQNYLLYKQDLIKPKSFPFIIKNFILIMSSLIVFTLLGLVF